MDRMTGFVTAAQAARQTGLSVKALRVYEERGLIAPLRTEAGWRAYGPDQMARARDIAGLRRLGFSLAEIGEVLAGETAALEPALARHAELLEARLQEVGGQLSRVSALRQDIASGGRPTPGAITKLLADGERTGLSFALPWPWGGECFDLPTIRPLTFIVGPLGSGKTRLARQIAAALPGAAFIPLDRSEETPGALLDRLAVQPSWAARVDEALQWLFGEGARPGHALTCLVAALEDRRPSAVVVDMVEQGLDQPTQEAVIAFLRARATESRPVFLMTRSSAILALETVSRDETIVFCPANHAPPFEVPAVPGARGYEAVEGCLATPDVRARTAGVIAWRPGSAAPEASARQDRGGS